MSLFRSLAPWIVALAAFAAPARAAMIINAMFDNSITSDPNAAAIEATINSAIAVYEKDFLDPITVNINFQEMTTGLGESSTFFANVSYATYLGALQGDATSGSDATAIASLGNSVNNPVTGYFNDQRQDCEFARCRYQC
jgi:hypothetical protein